MDNAASGQTSIRVREAADSDAQTINDLWQFVRKGNPEAELQNPVLLTRSEANFGTIYYVVEVDGSAAAFFALTELRRPSRTMRLVIHEMVVAHRFRGTRVVHAAFEWICATFGAHADLFSLNSRDEPDVVEGYRMLGFARSHSMYMREAKPATE